MYTVYRTSNVINGKYYIGVHKTNEPNDDYLGSGKVLRSAIRKYGRENFNKQVLFIFDEPSKAWAKEKELVAESLHNPLCYNLKYGGCGGFDYLNSSGIAVIGSRKALQKITDRRNSDPAFDLRMRKVWSAAGKKGGTHPNTLASLRGFKPFLGKKHTTQTLEKMKEAGRKRLGARNGRFGKVWIYNADRDQSMVVGKEMLASMLENGWRVGRKMPLLPGSTCSHKAE